MADSPLGSIAFGAERAAGFLDDFGGDGKAEWEKTVLGGIERQEETFADFFGEAVSVVGDCIFDGGTSLHLFRLDRTRSRLPCIASAAPCRSGSRARGGWRGDRPGRVEGPVRDCV